MIEALAPGEKLMAARPASDVTLRAQCELYATDKRLVVRCGNGMGALKSCDLRAYGRKAPMPNGRHTTSMDTPNPPGHPA